jgi:hypothetical protein
MLTEIAASQWRELIDYALDFAKAEPWKWMDDGQIVGLIDPASNIKAYCSIMGRESEFKALALYPGKEGWWSYLQISNEDAASDPNEIMYKQRCIVLSFDAPERADADDIALLRHAGVNSQDLPWIPSFRSYLPGFVPSPPDQGDFEWLKLALPQVMTATQEIFAGKQLVPETGLDKAGNMLFRQRDAESHDWSSVWLKPDPNANFSPAQVQLSAELAAAAVEMPSRQAIWLMEEFFLPEPAEDPEGGRAFFPRAVIFFELESQEFRGLSLLHPDNWLEGVGESMVEMILNQGHRPSQLVLSRPENFVFMKPFCQALEIGINLDKSLDILPDLREAVLEMWREEN